MKKVKGFFNKKHGRTFSLFSFFSLVLFGTGLWLNPPPMEEFLRYPTGGILRDCEGNILRVTLGPGGEDCRPLATLAETGWCAKALVAAEDQRFYRHFGVDPLALLRASRQNLFSWRRVSGASTISMQAVRLVKLQPRNFANKMRETFSAIRLDWAVPKEDILLNVLNRVPMGSNLVGVGAGAEGWFGKPAQNLSLAEAALLAGLAQSPTRLRPDRNFAGAVKRQHYVLDRMAALGMVSARECAEAKAQPLEFRRSPRPFHAPWFCDFILSSNGANGTNFFTTLDPRIQRGVEALLQPRPGDEGIDFAAVVVRVEDGALLALSCSGDYFKQGVNLAAAPRSAGSTLKPFAFAMAFDLGRITRDSPLFDEPVAYRGYLPRNFDGGFSGRVSAEEALVKSLNIPALHVLSLVGQPAFHRLLGELGFAHIRKPAEHYGAGLVIGNAPVTLVELARAYAVFGRGGCKFFSPETARLVTEILSGDERARDAVGHVAEVELPRFAWKTGTSAGYRDAWTVAWDSRYVAAVWAGHRDGGAKNDGRVVGRKIAANRAWEIVRLLDGGGGFRMQSNAVERGRSVVERIPPPLARAPLRIVSPAPDSVFVVSDALPPEAQKIAVRAHCEGVVVLHWFVDGIFVAAQSSERAFLLAPEPGMRVVTCTAEDGSFATVRVRVKARE